MRTPIVLGSILALGVGLFAVRPLWSEEGGEKGGEGGGEMPEWMVAGPEHKKMAELAGEWTVAQEFWMMEGPDAVPSKGSARFEVILGGKFIRQTYSGDAGGMKFEGVGIDGFDRTTGKYTMFWCDSMGTGAIYGTGASKDGGKTVEYAAEMADPDTKKMMKIRMLHTEKTANEFTFEMFGEHEGKEAPFFTLTYTRKK